MERTIITIKEQAEELLCKVREDGVLKHRCIPFHNYFFIKEENLEEVLPIIKNYCLTYDVVQKANGEFVKLVFKNNFSRYKLKNILEEDFSIETFEADINAKKRFLIENQNIELHQDKILLDYLDIETDDRLSMEKDFSGNTVATSCVTSIAFKDTNNKITYFCNTARDTESGKRMKALYISLVEQRKHPPSPQSLEVIRKIREQIAEEEKEFDKILFEHEKILLQKIIEYLKDYDCAQAWNGWRFDFTYLKQRCEIHNLNYSENLLMDIDAMELYKKNGPGDLPSYSLNKVAEHEFKDEINNPDSKFKNLEEVQKIDWKELTGLKKFFEFYLLEPQLFEEYNIQDVNLMMLIEEKMNFLKIQFVLSRLCHCFLDETLHNSKSFDYAMLNEYFNRDLVAPSKPTREQKEAWMNPITGVFPPGAFTYVLGKGVYFNLDCFDFKSQYPTHGVTYNISPDTFVESRPPELELIFNEKEIQYIKYCENIAVDFLDSKGKLNKKKYEADIDVKAIELGVRSMDELMWHFAEHYVPSEKTQKWLKDNNYVMTPTDLNYSTRGWKSHPHQVFKREEGVFPKLCKYFLTERDKVKYSMKKLEYHSIEWDEANNYQLALKTEGNSGYGYFAFKSGRFFCMEIPEAITTSSRFSTKKSILFAKKHGYESSHGDTDSAYLYNVENKFSIEEMNEKFYNYYDEMVKPYNTGCEVTLYNPITKEPKVKNHFIVFEHEKHLEACIVVKKKRYYYKRKK